MTLFRSTSCPSQAVSCSAHWDSWQSVRDAIGAGLPDLLRASDASPEPGPPLGLEGKEPRPFEESRSPPLAVLFSPTPRRALARFPDRSPDTAPRRAVHNPAQPRGPADLERVYA